MAEVEPESLEVLEDEQAIEQERVDVSTSVTIGSTSQAIGLHLRDAIGRALFKLRHRLGGLLRKSKAWAYYHLIDWTNKAVKVREQSTKVEAEQWTYGTTKEAVAAGVISASIDQTSLAAGGDDTFATVAGNSDLVYTSHSAAAPDQAASLSVDVAAAYLAQYRSPYVRGTGNKAFELTLVDSNHTARTTSPAIGDYGHLIRYAGTTNNNYLHLDALLVATVDQVATIGEWVQVPPSGGWQMHIATPEQNKTWSWGASWRWRTL